MSVYDKMFYDAYNGWWILKYLSDRKSLIFKAEKNWKTIWVKVDCSWGNNWEGDKKEIFNNEKKLEKDYDLWKIYDKVKFVVENELVREIFKKVIILLRIF